MIKHTWFKNHNNFEEPPSYIMVCSLTGKAREFEPSSFLCVCVCAPAIPTTKNGGSISDARTIGTDDVIQQSNLLCAYDRFILEFESRLVNKCYGISAIRHRQPS
jgi:hypothetical protein